MCRLRFSHQQAIIYRNNINRSVGSCNDDTVWQALVQKELKLWIVYIITTGFKLLSIDDEWEE